MTFCGKKKAVTFSFDDGNQDDIRLVELLNRYNLKATFNLNAGRLTGAFDWQYKDCKAVHHINYCDCPHLYDGHEIAAHSYSHPHLLALDDRALENEIRLDKQLLEVLYGQPIRGMAYPYGSYDGRVMEVLRENGLEYGRAVASTYEFALPAEPLAWHPTCHWQDEKLTELAARFLDSGEDGLLLYIWGHSYEMVTEADWDRFEAFCRLIAGKTEIFYGTNIQVLDCIHGGK